MSDPNKGWSLNMSTMHKTLCSELNNTFHFGGTSCKCLPWPLLQVDPRIAFCPMYSLCVGVTVRLGNSDAGPQIRLVKLTSQQKRKTYQLWAMEILRSIVPTLDLMLWSPPLQSSSIVSLHLVSRFLTTPTHSLPLHFQASELIGSPSSSSSSSSSLSPWTVSQTLCCLLSRCGQNSARFNRSIVQLSWNGRLYRLVRRHVARDFCGSPDCEHPEIGEIPFFCKCCLLCWKLLSDANADVDDDLLEFFSVTLCSLRQSQLQEMENGECLRGHLWILR